MKHNTAKITRSNSYLNILRPYLYEQPIFNYATCPPLNLHLKNKHKFNFGIQHPISKNSLYLSSDNIRTSIMQYDWKDSNGNGKSEKKSLQSNKSCYFNKTIMQRSLPIFEVLPVLSIYDRKEFLKNYIYGINTQDYLKFFQIVKRKPKYSDSDIIFGKTRKCLTNNFAWEQSRIEWLIQLESRQEEQNHRKIDSINLDECEEDVNILCCFPFIHKKKHNSLKSGFNLKWLH